MAVSCSSWFDAMYASRTSRSLSRSTAWSADAGSMPRAFSTRFANRVKRKGKRCVSASEAPRADWNCVTSTMLEAPSTRMAVPR